MANNTVDLVREVRDVAQRQSKLFNLPLEGAHVCIEEVTVAYGTEEAKRAHGMEMARLGYTAIREERCTDGFDLCHVTYTR